MKVLIADDHPIVRDGLRMILEAQPDVEVVGEAATGEEAVERVRAAKPDIVLMDLAMPGINGAEATALIRKEHPSVRILALTVHESEHYFFRALHAGASGYLIKGATTEELLEALRAVERGGLYLYPTLAKKFLEDYLRRMDTGELRPVADGLTKRETEILRLVSQGLTNQEIANSLSISPNTVQVHRSHIMEKLNLHNRTELIKYAVRRGLLDLED